MMMMLQSFSQTSLTHMEDSLLYNSLDLHSIREIPLYIQFSSVLCEYDSVRAISRAIESVPKDFSRSRTFHSQKVSPIFPQKEVLSRPRTTLSSSSVAATFLFTRRVINHACHRKHNVSDEAR